MRVAVVSDDGATVSQHFGRAPYYVVFDLKDGEVASREVREKGYHGSHQHHGEESGPHQHGTHSHNHATMVSPIADCSVVIAGGMGAGAYNSLRSQGIEPVFVRSSLAEDAVVDYLAGRTIDHSLCRH